MADSKSSYSTAASKYSKVIRHGNMLDALRYSRSKLRESQYNDSWKRNSVNINDVVNRFTPGVKGKPHGVKYEFENSRYIVKADMPAGYLRIYDKTLRQYVKLDGTPGTLEETHFKIKKRSEM
ncbi:MAG: hypothetical protein J5476_10950 [Lachnospiraceae bacterium]|nr:hypothetical protein [Lachnospiraceae bacterium]